MALDRQITVWWGALIVGGALLAFSPAVVGNVRPTEYEGGRSRSEAAERARNSSAIGRLMGEMRTSMSDVMFIKTERYLHMGVAYAAHMGGNPDNEMANAHIGTATLIRPPEEDFRGFIGNMERAIRPWRDPGEAHIHADGRELLPWFRLMTLTDPHYIRGYLIGSWWLNQEAPDQALDFINEGVRHNRSSFQIWLMKGQILRGMAERQRDNESARDALRLRALAAFREGCELVLRQRPAGEDPPAILSWWSEYVENDARAVCQLAVLFESRFGDREAAIERARRVLEVIPNEGVSMRELERLTAPVEEMPLP